MSMQSADRAATRQDVLTMFFDAEIPATFENGQDGTIGNNYGNDTGVEEDYNDMPELTLVDSRSEVSYIDQYDGVPELMYELSENELGEGIFKTKFMCYFDYQSAPNGPVKEKVQQWQEQTAHVHPVCKGAETEEEQDHNYRHGAQYWESVD